MALKNHYDEMNSSLEFVIKHYKYSKGKLKFWGDILQCHIVYDDELLVLNIQG